MAEYIDIDDQVVVTDTRGRKRETTVRHIFEMNKGVYTAADVRPVVYCKECKHRPVEECRRIMAPKYADGYSDYKCPFLCDDPWYNRMPADDYYCSLGSKRGEDDG